ncbi:hypothetical protein N7540_001024 [Penicillium herquei]|nr:hypothetical protein N7540_001024 [Penicillium herquei]
MHFPLTTLFSSAFFAILVSSQVVDLDKTVQVCNDSFGIPSAVPVVGGFYLNDDCDEESVKEAAQLIQAQIPGAEILGVTNQVVSGSKSVFFVVYIIPMY